ncbi:MAG: cytochrome C oxidase subunit IV family protein [Deltaproteobacteria bacterium]
MSEQPHAVPLANAPEAHGSHATRKQYFGIFLLLAVLTVLEVGLVKMPGIGKHAMLLGLVLLALTKAALVGLFFMHLKWETQILRWMIGIPLATPAVYAVVLIADAMARRP